MARIRDMTEGASPLQPDSPTRVLPVNLCLTNGAGAGC